MNNEMDETRDADLIRHLDGEPHGEVSAEAQARLEILRRRSGRLSGLLAQLDPGAAETNASAAAIRARLAQRTGLPVALKIAASIVLLLGVTLAVPPARAWVLQRARAAAEVLGLAARGKTASAPVTSKAGEIPQSAAVRVSFPVTSDTFEFVVTPPAGQIVVRHSENSLGTAEATGAPDNAFTVLRGLRIEGPPSPGAIYTITLPNHVTAVRLRGRVLPLPATAELRLDLANN